MNPSKWREDFPILMNMNEEKRFIYMDSASTTLKPDLVAKAVNLFYTKYTSNVSRSGHFLSEELSVAFENARELISSFINAKKDEVVFTQNCTDSINLVANGLNLNPSDEVIISVLEHHSNYLPWTKHATVKTTEIDDQGKIDLNHLRSNITSKTKLISMPYVSNVTGNVQPVNEISKIAKEKGISFLVDASQAVGHIPVDVFDIDCEFMAFSGHKMLGPSGVGVLYGKNDALNELSSFRYGGGMVNKIMPDLITYMPSPARFEAGTPNIEGILGLGAAVKYLDSLGTEDVFAHLNNLESYCRNKLLGCNLISVPFTLSDVHTPIFPFRPRNNKRDLTHIANAISDTYGIAARSGYQCAQPFYSSKNIDGSIRISLYLYNTFEEIDFFINALYEIKDLLI